MKILCAFLVGMTLSYILLLRFLPKGNPLHEVLHLPLWWWKMWQKPKIEVLETKHQYGVHSRQYFLFLRPKLGETPKKNVVIYIHGGGWQFARPEGFRPNAHTLVAQGYAVFLPAHRKVPFYDYYDLRTDISLMVLEVLKTMKSVGLTHQKIILGGVSSGGNLAALLYFDQATLASIGITPNNFSGIFLLGAPLNLNAMQWSPPVYLFAGKRGSQKFQKANPIHYLKKQQNIACLGIHGTKDGLVEYASGASFFKKLAPINVGKTTFHTLLNGTHLDAASWAFSDKEAFEVLLKWMNLIEKR